MEAIRKKIKQCPEIAGFLLFILGGVAITCFTNHFFTVFSPFIIAYVVARLLRPMMVWIRRFIKIPNVINTLFCMIVFVLGAGGIVWLAGHYLFEGVAYLIDLLSSKETIDEIIATAQELGAKFDDLAEFLNIEVSAEDITGIVSDFAKGAISILSNFSIDIAMRVPMLLMSLIIGCIAAFYMLYDYDNIANAIMRQLSPKTKRLIDVFNGQALSSFMKMIFSYALVSAICFFELLIGFLILGIEDSSFIALLIAILDVLPVVGSGAVLIPWGIFALLIGQTTIGFGILILYAIITVVRQIIEPKIVGSQIGLHPLVTIASLYVGLKLMGGLGLIMGPLYIIVCKKLNEEGLLKFYKIKESDNPDNDVKTE